MPQLVLLFLLWRSWLFFLSWLGGKILPFVPRFPYADIFLIPSGLPDWLWSFANFDGVHYLTIASSGYWAQYTQVFFPLYPLFMAGVVKILPFLSYVTAGLLASNLFFLMAIVLFWKLLSIDYKRKKIIWMILFLILFPMSFFFGSLYTESFFLLLIVLSFYFARRKKWLWAGIFAALASATRLVGIFLLPALLWEWRENNFKNHKCILHSPILYLAPFGLIAYMLYLQLVFGDWLYFWHVQPIFGAERSGSSIVLLPQVFWRYLKILTSVSINKEAFWISLSEFVFTFGAIFCLIWAHIKKVRLSYLIFSWFVLIVPTLTGTLSSMPRYCLVAFPIYISLGLINNKCYKILILFTFFILLSLYTIFFTRGHWVS